MNVTVKNRPIQKRRQVQKRTAAPARIETAPVEIRLREVYLLGLTLLTAAAYFAYSFASDGFYQHDEASHFMNMRGFWHDPSSVLGNWAKPGYKLLYALPSLGGQTAVLITNCLVAALCCYVAYKLAEALGCKAPLFSFAFLAFQPFWIQLSFRNYSEIPSALLLLLAIYAHYRDKRLIAALVLSYTATIRQEFYPLLLLYGAFLAYRKQFVPAAALLLFPFLNNLWGWGATGDPLYLWHTTVATSGRYQDAYPRQGFDHYFKTSIVVFGAAALTFLVVYAGQVINRAQRLHLFVVAPLAVYFLEHCVFSLQAISIGPSTGGNLRYMLVIAPLVAVLAGLAADRLAEMKSRTRLLYVLIPFVLAVALFMDHGNNNLMLTEEVSLLPLLMVLITMAGALFVSRKSLLLVFVFLCATGFTLSTVRPFQRSPEDAVMAEVVAWAKQQGLDEHPLLVNHPMFYYFFGRSQWDFPEGASNITETTLQDAPPETVVIWDSHYSYRPRLKEGQVRASYFLERQQEFRPLLRPVIVRSGRHILFELLVMEKIAPQEGATPSDNSPAD
ncbi:MAG TPA: hypothetical protein VFG50_09800 [Rhodothermales bacterium]|nr:hypothetical protein [Rhodothermales bacterium]